MRPMLKMPFRLVVLSALAASVSGCVAAATPSPRPDYRPVPAIKLGAVLLRDDFDNPAAHQLSVQSDDPSVEQGYVGGEYQMRLSPSFREQMRLAGSTTPFANVQISADARLVGGTEARWIGLACRIRLSAGRSTGAYLLYVLPATGQFDVVRFDGESATRIVPLQSIPAIRRGTALNHLELLCVGSTIGVRINGTWVASVQDSTYDSGFVALLVGRSGSIPAEARFDNLVVREALLERQSVPAPNVTVQVRLSQGGAAFGPPESVQSLRCGLPGSSPPQAYHLYVEPRLEPLPQDRGDLTGRTPSAQALDSSTAEEDYLLAVEREVAARSFYPPSAVRDGQSGTVVILFSWLKDGRLRLVRLQQSSGFPRLDQNAVEAVRCAAPFAPIPDVVERDSITATATLGYVIQ